MKTYPIYKENGMLNGFEITSFWIRFKPLLKILESVNGVTDVKRQLKSDDRVTFKFHGHNAVVNEPWGDNSRYWVGFEEPDKHPETDVSKIHEAFKKYHGFTIF